MAGVGKTRLVMHLCNREYGDASVQSILWVPVPKDVNIRDLQTEIAKTVQVPEVLKENAEKERAKVLWEFLSERRKSELCLDDVWDHFELEEVGIPIRSDGPKLVLTTQSLSICHAMLCQQKIKIEGGNYVEMHGMIQNMAINIMNNSSPAKVMEITMDEEDWSSDLHMVFLKDFGGVIRDNMSPNCPKLSVLLMKDDYGLQKIPECFFMHLVQLKVLNLTNSNIEELPGSISELIHLRALVLRSCSKLSRMPSVVKMRSLKKLDLSLCKNLQAVPDGLENLVDLRFKIWSENISRCGKVIRIHGREDYEIRGRILALYISSEGTDSRQLLEIKVALHRIS
ncbi:hypothetical protein CRG98_013973 [Punica granatum]|uniref:Uncharacterized protein n=1 Tax=Punica granatum TaxID=22663 RepID=A0A2I0KAV9_PUNGR|nr:hypothetical protein CRG98_013973 [Punica granatum]